MPCAEVAQRKLQASILWMVVMSDAEGDVERISGEKFRSLQALCHVPAESVKGNVAAPT